MSTVESSCFAAFIVEALLQINSIKFNVGLVVTMQCCGSQCFHTPKRCSMLLQLGYRMTCHTDIEDEANV